MKRKRKLIQKSAVCMLIAALLTSQLCGCGSKENQESVEAWNISSVSSGGVITENYTADGLLDLPDENLRSEQSDIQNLDSNVSGTAEGQNNSIVAETVSAEYSVSEQHGADLITKESDVTPVFTSMPIYSPSAILIESSTGKVLYELNSTEKRSPAGITKIMTLLLAFEAIESGKVSLTDQVTTSEYASSMGGVYLATGEVQTLDTLIKCIAIASGNDASVAVAEHIAGSEQAFVEMMNEKAAKLGMVDTNFEDCCGLSDSDNHYTSARDVAIMSRELTTKYPEIFNYTTIWTEDITHETRRGTANYTLTNTNKLLDNKTLEHYQWATGLKTGANSKAKYCFSATASKNGIDLIAVVMGAPEYKACFGDAMILLNRGFEVCDIYVDHNSDSLAALPVEGGRAE